MRILFPLLLLIMASGAFAQERFEGLRGYNPSKQAPKEKPKNLKDYRQNPVQQNG